MENYLQEQIRPNPGVQDQSAELQKPLLKINNMDSEKKIRSSIKTINLSGDQLVITDEIPGVLIQGVQYYDLKKIGSINYTGMANLIDFIKSLLEQGVEVKFVNMNEKIKNKIKSIGLEHILSSV